MRIEDSFTSDQLRELLPLATPELRAVIRDRLTHPYYTFRPRPDNPQEWDEQSSACYDRDHKFVCVLGGTGSGKTEAMAWRTTDYLIRTPPPKPRTPFWVVGNTFEQVCGVCWQQKLSRYLTPDMWVRKPDWYKEGRNWPFAVFLKHPTIPNEIGWVVEFKSYSQGRSHMQGWSIGGYWCNEEIPLPLLEEIQGRCRDYDSPGWADFTPIEVISPEWPERYENPPEGWKFYHLNSLKNDALAEGFMERYLAGLPEDMRETRRIGVFATYRGMVFKEWRESIHVIREPDYFEIPHDWFRIRAIDFGYNNPFCCLWIARDHDGCYYVYDEHFESQRLNRHHAEQIHERPWLASEPWYGPTYCDHDAQQRAEFAQLGIPTVAAKKNVLRGIEALRRLLIVQGNGKPRLYVFERCKNLRREMRGYHWPDTIGKDAKRKDPVELPVPFDDHAVDALRYGIFSDLMNAGDGVATVQWDARDRPGVQLQRKTSYVGRRAERRSPAATSLAGRTTRNGN